MTVLLALPLMGASGLEVLVITLTHLAPGMAAPTLQTNVTVAGLSPTLALTPVLLAVIMTVLLALRLMDAFGLGPLVTILRLRVWAMGVQTPLISAFPLLLIIRMLTPRPTIRILTPPPTTLALPLQFLTTILGADVNNLLIMVQ